MLRRSYTMTCRAVQATIHAPLTQGTQIMEQQTSHENKNNNNNNADGVIHHGNGNSNRNPFGDSGNTMADVQALHAHCTRVIQTLGPATPPEAFVFRGNAYVALGKPYFALADYATASGVLHFSFKQHQAVCYNALSYFPQVQRAIFRATNALLHIHVEPWLHEEACVITHASHSEHNNNEQEQICETNSTKTNLTTSNVNTITTTTTEEELEEEEYEELCERKEDATEYKSEEDAKKKHEAALLDALVVSPLHRGVYYNPHNNTHNLTNQNNTICNNKLSVGSVISKSAEPWICYPLYDNHCAYCAAPLNDRVFACNVDEHHRIVEPSNKSSKQEITSNEPRIHRCHEEYCSRECRAKALNSYHALVCRNELYQALELDLFDKATKFHAKMNNANHSNNDKDKETSEEQCKRRNECKEEEEELEQERKGVISFYRIRENPYYYQLLLLRVMAVATQQHITAGTLAEVRLLTGRLTFAPADLCDEVLHLYLRLARALRIQTTSCYEEFISILSRLHCNCVFSETSIELTLPWAMFNHSCEANAAIDWASREIRATREIDSGSEILLNYAPETETWLCDKRQEFFKSYFDFTCSCARCKLEQHLLK